MKIAEVKGLSLVAVTDHYSELFDLPKRMTKRRLSEYLNVLEGFKLLKGVEVEILYDGTVSISRTTLSMFDVVIGGLHAVRGIRFWRDFTPVLDPIKYVEAVRVTLIKAMESKKLDVITHVTRLPEALLDECLRLCTDDWIESVVKAAGDHDVAVELNGAWKVPDERFVTECLRQGIKLSLGSDAHTSQMVGETSYGVEILKRLKIDKDFIFLPRKAACKL